MKIESSRSVSPQFTDSTAPGARTSTATPSVMPDAQQLFASGDPGAMFAALTMQTAKDERSIANKTRDAATAAEEKMDAASVQDMHDKATLQRIQGFVDGALQIGQGLCDLNAGLSEANQASQEASASADEAKVRDSGGDYSKDQKNALQADANTLKQGAATSKTHATWDHFGASAFGAARSIADGLFNGAITDKDADEKMHEASAAAFKRIADDAHDNENDAKGLLNKAVDFYKEYVDTKNQTAMAAIHRA